MFPTVPLPYAQRMMSLIPATKPIAMDLRHFLAVAHAGSLADAARRLKTSPATVGRRVAAIEARVGARLFDRRLRTARPEHHNLVVRRAGWWKCALYAAKSYAAAHDLKPGIRDLSNLDIIKWTEELAHLRGGPWFAKHAPDAIVALQANSRRIQYGACKAGLGLAILPCLSADHDPDLIRLLPPEQVFVAELYLVTHRDLVRTARVRAVVDFLHRSISDYTR
jgi:DNA-binding transcriptional LysR family regulator